MGWKKTYGPRWIANQSCLFSRGCVGHHLTFEDSRAFLLTGNLLFFRTQSSPSLPLHSFRLINSYTCNDVYFKHANEIARLRDKLDAMPFIFASTRYLAKPYRGRPSATKDAHCRYLSLAPIAELLTYTTFVYYPDFYPSTLTSPVRQHRGQPWEPAL